MKFMNSNIFKNIYNIGKRTAILLACCLSLGGVGNVYAQSPTTFGKKVKGMPFIYLEPLFGTNSIDVQGKTKLPWIVFSDRVDNHTTTSPGGSLMMEKLDFMQPFYVSEEKNGYLKLLRYQDNMVKGLKLKNKKSAESMGWIAKDKLLLWQKSYIDNNTHFPYKYLTIINDVDPLVNARYYFDRQDSVFVYDGPDLKTVRGKVALHNYVYVYKQSGNAKQYLIGTSDQFVAKQASKNIKGWVSAALVENWGGRVYIAPTSFDHPEVDQAVDNINSNNLRTNGPYLIDPLQDTTKLILTGLPLLSATDQSMMTRYALDVYNKDNNKLLTINGSELTYPSFLNLIKNRSKVNVVFVIDGSGTMKNHFSSLLNTIQSFETMLTSTFNIRALKFGSIVYRNAADCGVSGGKLPLTGDYRQLMAFLREQSNLTSNCNLTNANQPVFQAMDDAVRLVTDVPQQTNLFVVIGTTGNDGGSNSMQSSSLARRIADVDGRLLMLQSHNRPANGYTDYITEARKLVSSEAYYAAERRKFQLVEGEAFGQQVYDFNISDSISYYLDFPKASLVQGGVVFPGRGGSLQVRSYQAALTRFLNETKMDIKNHLHSLDSAFRLTGIENRNVSNGVRAILEDRFNNQVGDNMPHNEFKFASTLELSTNLFKDSTNTVVEKNLVLNQNEFSELIDILNTLAGGNLQADASNFRSKFYKNYFSVLKDRKGRKVPSGEVNKWTIGKYMQEVLGIPADEFAYGTYSVRSLNRVKEMNTHAFEGYVAYLRSTIVALKSYSQGAGKFQSNGETYYRVRGSLFTGNKK